MQTSALWLVSVLEMFVSAWFLTVWRGRRPRLRTAAEGGGPPLYVHRRLTCQVNLPPDFRPPEVLMPSETYDAHTHASQEDEMPRSGEQI